MKRIIIPIVVSLLIAACATSVEKVQTPKPGLTAPGTKSQASTPTSLSPEIKLIIRTSSMSLIVEDPVEALSMLEQAVEDAGGTVMSASSYSYPESGAYSNLNARVPPEALTELRRTTRELADEIQNDSVYNQDVTAQYRMLHDRLVDLNQAETHLWRLIADTQDARMVESLSLLRELVQQDVKNVESEMLNYEEGARLASFDITISGSPEAVLTIE